MSFATKTLTQLRTEMATFLKMPFFEYFGSAGSTITTKTDTTTFIDTDLIGLPDNYFKGAWLLVTSDGDIGEVRRITAFTGASGSFDVHAAFANLVATDSYEIWSGFSPHIMTSIINRVIRESFPEFHESKYNEELIIKRDTRTYSLTGLSDDVGFLSKIWIEEPAETKRDTVASATATEITMPSGIDLTDVDSNWRMSCYEGTGAGEQQAVVSVASQVITTGSWTTTLDSTSRVLIWNAANETNRWEPFPFYGIDSPRNPSKIVFRQLRNDMEGHRVRLQIQVPANDLSALTDTTVVPPEYVVRAGLSQAHMMLMERNRAARGHHERQHLLWLQMAEDYKAANQFQPPSYQMQRDPEFSGHGLFTSSEEGNPLGW